MENVLQKILGFLHDQYSVEVMVKNFGQDRIDIAQLISKKILVNSQSRDEVGIIFVIAHLFGHMVQYTNYESYRHLIEKTKKPKPLKLSQDFKKEFYEYEVEGYRIGKGLLEAVFSSVLPIVEMY